MEVTVKKPWLKVGILLSFIIMVAVNALANILPLNGVQTGAVSDLYPNLFTPAPITFAIWGVIYLTLAVYVVFQLLPVRGEGDASRQSMLRKVGHMFIFTSLLNAGWIFAWHYYQMNLTMILMVLLLAGLMRIGWLLRTPHCSPKEELALRIPFGIYFGWITVATIANASALLVSLKWDGFGLSAPLWTAIILAVGVLIAGTTMFRTHNPAYGLAVIWAFVGILIRHLSPAWYGGQYTLIVIAAIVSIAALLVVWGATVVHTRRDALCHTKGR